MSFSLDIDRIRPDGLTDEDGRQRFRSLLLDWYAEHQRTLPWRETHDPYAIWISEIMLQQTQVATVIPFYHRFLERFPHVSALAEAAEDDVLKYWEGLGYYRRARQLHAAAKQIVDLHRGGFPSTIDAVRQLPGIGRYTAGAILSFSLNQSHPILEANTIRLFTRLLNCHDLVTLASTQARLWKFAESLLPTHGAGILNQALIELGSQVCSPQEPACRECPVRSFCQAQAAGTHLALPKKPAARRGEKLVEAVVIVRKEDQILMRRCQEGERWAGLWDFPRISLPKTLAKKPHHSHLDQPFFSTYNLQLSQCQYLGTLKHAVMHYLITLHAFEGSLGSNHDFAHAKRAVVWIPKSEVPRLPLSSTGRIVVQWL